MHLDCILQLPLQDPNLFCLPLLHKNDVRIQYSYPCTKYHFALFPEEQEGYV